MDFGTSYALALSSGVNAYFPLLAFAMAARWLHLYKVNPSFSFVTTILPHIITSFWLIGQYS